MNHYDAQEIIRRHLAGLPISYASVKEAESYLIQHRPAKAKAAALTDGAVSTAPNPVHYAVVPPMDALCVCGRRYGMHRVGDFACPNQNWRPGNGQVQWLSTVFRRA